MLSCADSRVPAEIVLTQGLGFVVVRMAGNVVSPTAVGSLNSHCGIGFSADRGFGS